MSHIGAKIRAERVARGVTLPTLAAQAGISKGLLSTIETNELSNPSIGTLTKIADALDTSVANIITSKSQSSSQSRRQPKWIMDVETSLSAEGLSPDGSIIEAMHVLQRRKGLETNNISYWTSLYKSIETGYKK